MMTAPRPTKTVSAEKMARLQGWSDRKPVIAIMGEFSAGKSTLLNMLIGQAILPTQITATKLPPVWLRHGTGAPYRVDRNNERHPIDLNNLTAIPLKDTRYIRIYVESEVLESCDLLDTPGISDPNIPMTMWFKTLGYASAALWCTHAGQAWRESERGAWESLPERLRRHSILLVTRADKITTEIDRMKIDNRLRRETDNLFGARLFISLVNALRALEGEGDADLWAASGAEAFVENLAGAIAAINEDRAVAIKRFRLDPNATPRVAPRRIRAGEIGSAPSAPAAASAPPAPAMPAASGGADVVPLRPRVVASNEGPSERPVDRKAAPEASLRGAFLRSDPSELVEHEPDADLEADFVDVDAEFGDSMADLAEADWATETAEAVEEAIDPELLAMSEEYGIDIAELTEQGMPAAPTVAVEPETMAEDLGFDDPVEEPATEAPIPAAYALETPEVVEVEWQDADFATANLADHDLVSAEIVAEPELKIPDTAEETISAVMASFAGLEQDDPLTGDSQDDDHYTDLPEGRLTASTLWKAVLAGRKVQTVQDVMAAMTDFVEQLDAAGFRLDDEDDGQDQTSSETNFRALRAQRRQARLARQRRA